MSPSNIDIDLVRHLFKYDQYTGDFIWWNPRSTKLKRGDVAGCINQHGYRAVIVDYTSYLAHRLIWAIHYGEQPPKIIDHIDRNRLNNSIENLRSVDSHGNISNSLSRVGSSGLHGAHFVKSKQVWRSAIRVNGKQIYLGTFKTKEDASAAYMEAKAKYHKTFTVGESK